MVKAKQSSKKGDKQPKESDEKLSEMRRLQQLNAKNELTLQLKTEVENSKINSLKIKNQWRKIMRLAKAESLKKDVEILSQNHERDVDRKDAILQMLDRDLEEAEDQFQMALRTHLTNIDILIQLHDTRLYSLEKNFHSELLIMQKDFHFEKEKMLNKFKLEKKELISVIETIEHDELEREAESKHSYEQLREEIRNRNLEEINMLRISLDAQIEELEQHFETAHLNYLQQTAQRTHDFKELTQNDQRLSREIELKKRKIDNLLILIQQWKAKIRQLNRETEERNRLLLEEKHAIQRHYQQLKQRISAYRGTQTQRLLILSEGANSCKAKLNQKLDLARRVLQLAELARKMETQQEQILPYAVQPGVSVQFTQNNQADQQQQQSPAVPEGSVPIRPLSLNKTSPPNNQTSVWSHVPTPNQVDPHQRHASASSSPQVPHFISSEDRLWNFHRKYNQALLDCLAIDREKERLEKENAQLQDLITQFINGTRVSDEILAADNPLFVVNGRANLNHVPPVRAIKPTIQDAGVIQSTLAVGTGYHRR